MEVRLEFIEYIDQDLDPWDTTDTTSKQWLERDYTVVTVPLTYHSSSALVVILQGSLIDSFKR